jgi:hypothetical protein
MGTRKKRRAAWRRGLSADQRRRARAELLYDPGTEPALAAQILSEVFGTAPVAPDVAPTIRTRCGMDRLRAVSEAALARGRDAAALSLAADVAIMDGRADEAERDVGQALRIVDHPDLHLRRAMALASQDRLAEALDVLDGQLRANPGLEAAQFVRRDLLARAEPEAVARFLDRTALEQLLAAFARRAGDHGTEDWIEAGAATEEEVAAWTAGAEADPRSPGARRLRLIGEWAWLMPVLDGDRAPLEALADDESAPPDLRRHAGEWLTWALWGLWELARPDGSPGVVLTDLLTGVRLAAEVPGHVLDGLPRWSVLLGYLVPVDGVWRAGSDFDVAAPLEARLLMHELLDDLMANEDEVGKEGQAMIKWARSVHDDLGALWHPDLAEPPSPEATLGLQLGARAFAPHLVAGLRAMRGATPHEHPSGAYELTFDDPHTAWHAMAAHGDFVPAEGGGLAWIDPDDEDETRAYVDRSPDGDIHAEAEEDELAALLDLLRGIGHPATAEELAEEHEPPEPPAVLPDLPATELEGWLQRWPDEPLEVFDGISPRDAVRDYEAGTDVELLIRYLEHDADSRGMHELDTDALRVRLGLKKQ